MLVFSPQCMKSAGGSYDNWPAQSKLGFREARGSARGWPELHLKTDVNVCHRALWEIHVTGSHSVRHWRYDQQTQWVGTMKDKANVWLELQVLSSHAGQHHLKHHGVQLRSRGQIQSGKPGFRNFLVSFFQWPQERNRIEPCIPPL